MNDDLFPFGSQSVHRIAQTLRGRPSNVQSIKFNQHADRARVDGDLLEGVAQAGERRAAGRAGQGEGDELVPRGRRRNKFGQCAAQAEGDVVHVGRFEAAAQVVQSGAAVAPQISGGGFERVSIHGDKFTRAIQFW